MPYKSFSNFLIEDGDAAGTASSIALKDIPLGNKETVIKRVKPSGTSFGYPYFQVSTDLYYACLNGSTSIKENEQVENIKSYLNENINTKLLLKNNQYEEYCFINQTWIRQL